MKDRLILVSLLGAGIINILLWVILASKFGYSQDQIPLHFSVVYGIDFLGSSRQIYQLPATGLVILLVNWLLAKGVYPSFRIFSYFLTCAAFAVQAILFVAVMSLMFVN